MYINSNCRTGVPNLSNIDHDRNSELLTMILTILMLTMMQMTITMIVMMIKTDDENYDIGGNDDVDNDNDDDI